MCFRLLSPDGQTSNLGEIITKKNGHVQPRTQMPTFSLFVTAEPYFSVRLPSEMLVIENETRKNTKGKIFIVNDYKLMRRTQYQKIGNPLALTLDLKNVPLEVYEARNAVEFAKSREADKYAPEIFSKAEARPENDRKLSCQQSDKKPPFRRAADCSILGRCACSLCATSGIQERIANERAAAAAKAKAEAEATAATEAAEAKRKADAEAQRQAELSAAKEDALKAKEDAAKADAERARKAQADLRAQLLDQFNRVLATRDAPRKAWS